MSMSEAPSRFARFEFLGSAMFTNALVTAIVATAASTFTLTRLIGWAGLIGVLSTLAVLAICSGIMRRSTLDWQGLLPISLIAFLAWSALTIVWSQYQWVTLSGLLYQFVFALLAVYIALTRDMIQIVRVFGNVLRFVLGSSLVLEVISGILVDAPIRLLGIEGNIVTGEPVQGIVGDSTQLGVLSLLAGVTFWIELSTRSVHRPTAFVSLGGAAFMVLLTHSTVITSVAGLLIIAGLVLTGIRSAKPEARQPITWALLSAAFVTFVIGAIFRDRLLDAIQGSDQLANKLGLWRQIQTTYIPINNLEGWGWIGKWNTDLVPFIAFRQVRGNDYASAYNTFIDVWFQVGLVGLVIFLGLVGLALVRSWHLAVRQPSVVYLWPALVLVGLVALSITESVILVDFCWMVLVICVVKSANKLSWRLTFARIRPAIE